jgi:hypothetical protein
MAAGDVGREVVYHDEHGDHIGFVADYVAGRDAGDHWLGGFTNSSAVDAGTGPTLAVWSVYRNTGEQGTFSFFGEAIVPPDTGETPGEPGIPTHPIYRPDLKPEHPIVLPEPPTDGDAHPEHPIYLPPSIWPDPGHPAHPIAPGGPPPHVEHPIPPIVWPNPPEGGQPEPPSPGHPSHPIYFPDLKPEHPIVLPPNSLPTFDLDRVTDHPELPNLDSGFWAWLDADGTLCWGFVTNPLAAEHPIVGTEPSEDQQPGQWLVTALGSLFTWAWVPENAKTYPPSSDGPHVEHHGRR